MKLIRHNSNEIGVIAAKQILADAKKIAKKKEQIILALPGGRSVKPLYEEFAKSNDAVWKKIHIFLVDERAAANDSSDSNFKLIKDSFADKLVHRKILPAKNLHPFVARPDKNEFGVQNYNLELRKFGGKFSIVVLAAGEDGHIAALFPNHRKNISGKIKEYVLLDNSPKPPPTRITANAKLIMSATNGVLFFIGDAKKAALKNFIDKKVTEFDCPAKIAGKIRNITAYTDIELKAE